VRDFVAGLGLPAETADRIAALTPATYIGLAEKLVDEYLA
jgi:adenylosuccinate lyase